MWMNLQEALRHPHLLRWIVIVFIAGMLDDVFIGFTALFLKEGVHANPAEISLAFGGQTAGGVLGLVFLNYVLQRFPMKRLLVLGACLALAGFVGLLSTSFLWVASIALFVLGLGVSTWYPLAKAAAYESLPGRSGTVGAVIDLTAPLQAVVPLAVGFVSQQFGVAVGIGLLGFAPIAVLLLIPYSQASHRLSERANNENGR
jgi:MFS family permease